MNLKFCTRCNCEKPESDFRVKRIGADGLPRLRNDCRLCEWGSRSDEARERKRERERGMWAKPGYAEKNKVATHKYRAKKAVEAYGYGHVIGMRYGEKCTFMVRQCECCAKVEALKRIPFNTKKCVTCSISQAQKGVLKKRIDSVCPDCGDAHKAARATARCEPCNRVLRKQNRDHISRAKKHGVAWENINSRIVYVKDKYRCYLCRVKVVVSAKYRPDQATIDCVLPMSAGGPFMYHNVKTCCHRCNSAKSDLIYNKEIVKHAKGATQYRLAI